MNVTLAPRGDVLAAIAHAREIRLSAYVLAANAPLVRALESAAERGARVAVTLDGDPYLGAPSTDAVNPNLETAADFARHGVRVRLTEPSELPMHLKAAVIDGRAYLDDRNWPVTGTATVVTSTDEAAVRAVDDAIDGRPASSRELALQKGAALAQEAATIRDAPGDRVDVETESFGSSVVADALCARARAGARVRLAVNGHVLAGDRHGREHAALARLAAAGVAVEMVGAAEKFAVGSGSAWVGSANATSNDAAMLDWGIRSADPALVAALEASFERAWARGVPFAATYSPKSAAAVAVVRSTTSSTENPRCAAMNAAVAAM